tara:strand:+ start:1175 stop:2344 length:1170 start_codon:yes stop_codon:yes gene_type:complete
MKRVLVRAPLLTNSGYGVHSRQVFSWLLKESKARNFEIDVECLNWGNCSWIVEESKEDGLVKEIMQRSKPLNAPYDVTFQIQLPDEWNADLGNFNVGITAAVESDKCNPKWLECCNKMDHIIVPSTFTKNVLKRSGMLLKKISVVPEWYHETIGASEIDAIDLNLKTTFNFLTIGMLTHTDPAQDRKNLVNTISLLCKKFKDNEEIGIVVKTCLGKNSSFDRKKTKEYLSQIAKSAKGNSAYPKIYLLHGDMTKKEMASLYKSKDINCYVSLTRAEGYGLPLVEAAAAGLPIIATNYSGHLEFLKGQPFLPVDYTLISIPDEKIDKRIFVKDTKWAEPSKESYFTNLDEVYYNYEYNKNNALNISDHICENFSRSAIVKKYNKLFAEVL